MSMSIKILEYGMENRRDGSNSLQTSRLEDFVFIE